MLQFPGEWKFAPVAEIPPVGEAVSGYFRAEVLIPIATSSPDPKSVLETFKSCFGAQSTSSSTSWAMTDLAALMDGKETNAVVFIDALWRALEAARNEGLAVPSSEQVNAILRRNHVGYEIRLPKLVQATADAWISATPAGRTESRYTLGDKLVHRLRDGIKHSAMRA